MRSRTPTWRYTGEKQGTLGSMRHCWKELRGSLGGLHLSLEWRKPWQRPSCREDWYAFSRPHIPLDPSTCHSSSAPSIPSHRPTTILLAFLVIFPPQLYPARCTCARVPLALSLCGISAHDLGFPLIDDLWSSMSANITDVTTTSLTSPRQIKERQWLDRWNTVLMVGLYGLKLLLGVNGPKVHE